MAKAYIWIPTCDWAMAPSLVCSAKPTDRRDLFVITITHPNTKNVLFTQRIRASSFVDALSKAKSIKQEQLAHIKTEFEEIKFIPRPKKGKFTLKTKK
jgi:hypothetical protein